MQFSSAFLALVALAADSALAASLKHRHLHQTASPAIEKRQSVTLSDTGLAKLKAIGFGSQSAPATGVNAQTAGSGVWIGGDGAYTSTFNNETPNGVEVILVVWGNSNGYSSSFPEVTQPLITVSIPSGGSTTLSFDTNQSGAWAGVYPDTVLSQYGQIKNTWGEFTMSPSGVVDVSREVFTQGNNLSIVGPVCTTDMTQCTFICNDASVTTCGDAGSYHLANCTQNGANVSPDDTAGGCGWNGAAAASFTTTFS